VHASSFYLQRTCFDALIVSQYIVDESETL
jgi:hypothetical protein